MRQAALKSPVQCLKCAFVTPVSGANCMPRMVSNALPSSSILGITHFTKHCAEQKKKGCRGTTALGSRCHRTQGYRDGKSDGTEITHIPATPFQFPYEKSEGSV